MSLFDSSPDFPSAVAALHTAATVAAYATALDVNQYEILSIQISGTWTGKVRVQAEIAGTSFYTFLPMYDTNGKLIPDGFVTTNGIYRVNVAGYAKVRTRVEPASGSVDVSGRLSRGAVLRSPNPTGRIQVVASALNQTVAAGTRVNMTAVIDVSDYPFLFAAARADSSGSFKVSWEPRINTTVTFGQMSDFIDVLDVELRGISDWLSAQATYARFSIINNDASDHEFDFFLYGVR